MILQQITYKGERIGSIHQFRNEQHEKQYLMCISTRDAWIRSFVPTLEDAEAKAAEKIAELERIGIRPY